MILYENYVPLEALYSTQISQPISDWKILYRCWLSFWFNTLTSFGYSLTDCDNKTLWRTLVWIFFFTWYKYLNVISLSLLGYLNLGVFMLHMANSLQKQLLAWSLPEYKVFVWIGKLFVWQHVDIFLRKFRKIGRMLGRKDGEIFKKEFSVDILFKN